MAQRRLVGDGRRPADWLEDGGGGHVVFGEPQGHQSEGPVSVLCGPALPALHGGPRDP